MNVLCRYVRFHAWKMITKGDISVQKIKVEKCIFIFPDPSFDCYFYKCLHKQYFIISYSFGYLMIQDRLQCKIE